MNYINNTSTTINKMLLPLFVVVSFFLFFSCNDNKKEIPFGTEVEIKDNAFEHTSKTADEILALEKAWAAALVAYDLTVVDSMMHRDFRLKGIKGDQQPISKEMYLGMTGMSASMAEVTSVKIIEEMGPLAVVRVTWTMDWEREGVGKLPPYWDLIDTWMKREDGTWQVLSRLSQPADKPYESNKKNIE